VSWFLAGDMNIKPSNAFSLRDVTIWPTHDKVDGYICESLSSDTPSPSSVLSKYFGKPVHLIYKGPRPRPIDPTTSFPDLEATAFYQDMYPLLVLSEESTSLLEHELRGYVGTQGIHERWKTDPVPIERYVQLSATIRENLPSGAKCFRMK